MLSPRSPMLSPRGVPILSPRGAISQAAASKVADSQPDQTAGQKVSVHGRTGTLAWDGRPAHGYVKVCWDDDGTKSDCIKVDQVTFPGQVPSAAAVAVGAGQVGADLDVSPGIEVKKAVAPWRQGQNVAEESVWKPEDFPSLNPACEPHDESFPSLNRSTTPRRSLSRTGSAKGSINEGNRSDTTPRRGRIGSISEGKPQVSCIPEDKPHHARGRRIPEDKLPIQRGYLQQSCPSLQTQQQRQQPQLQSAWQQRGQKCNQRTAKSVEPEQRQVQAPRADSATRQPAAARAASLTRQAPKHEEVGNDAPKNHPAESSQATRPTMPPGKLSSSESRCNQNRSSLQFLRKVTKQHVRRLPESHKCMAT